MTGPLEGLQDLLPDPGLLDLQRYLHHPPDLDELPVGLLWGHGSHGFLSPPDLLVALQDVLVDQFLVEDRFQAQLHLAPHPLQEALELGVLPLQDGPHLHLVLGDGAEPDREDSVTFEDRLDGPLVGQRVLPGDRIPPDGRVGDHRSDIPIMDGAKLIPPAPDSQGAKGLTLAVLGDAVDVLPVAGHGVVVTLQGGG